MKKPDGKRVENFVHTMNQKRTIYFRLWTSGKRHKRLYMSELHEFLNWKNSLPSKKIKHWIKMHFEIKSYTKSFASFARAWQNPGKRKYLLSYQWLSYTYKLGKLKHMFCCVYLSVT